MFGTGSKNGSTLRRVQVTTDPLRRASPVWTLASPTFSPAATPPTAFTSSSTGSRFPPGSLESVGIDIIAPTDSEPNGTLTAILSRYAGGNTGSAPVAGIHPTLSRYGRNRRSRTANRPLLSRRGFLRRLMARPWASAPTERVPNSPGFRACGSSSPPIWRTRNWSGRMTGGKRICWLSKAPSRSRFAPPGPTASCAKRPRGDRTRRPKRARTAGRR